MEAYIWILLVAAMIFIGVYLGIKESKGTKRTKNPEVSPASIEYSCPDAIPGKPSGETAYVFIDVETTGLSPRDDDIVQVSAVRYFGDKAADGINTYINPGRSIPTKATQIHGITDAMVKKAPSIGEIRGPFLDLINGAVLVGYNTTFDLNFLNKAFDDALANVEYIDVMWEARNRLVLSDYKLETVATCLGIRPDGAFHNALHDCKSTAAIFFQLGLHEDPGLIRVYHSRITTRTQREMPLMYSNEQSESYWYGSPSYECWVEGEQERIAGNIEKALRLFDQSKAMARNNDGSGPAIYESYAKAYRKMKDYEREISVLEEAIQCCTGSAAEDFTLRKKKAENLLASRKRQEEEAKQREEKRAKREERKRLEEEKAKNRQPLGRPIMQLDENGSVIKVFESVTAAAKEVGVSTKGIRSAACGIQKHAGGFVWKYVSDEEAADNDSKVE